VYTCVSLQARGCCCWSSSWHGGPKTMWNCRSVSRRAFSWRHRCVWVCMWMCTWVFSLYIMCMHKKKQQNDFERHRAVLLSRIHILEAELKKQAEEHTTNKKAHREEITSIVLSVNEKMAQVCIHIWCVRVYVLTHQMAVTCLYVCIYTHMPCRRLSTTSPRRRSPKNSPTSSW
jgi:hypothetical protein